MDRVFDQMGTQFTKFESDLRTQMDKVDPNDQGSLLKLQHSMNKWKIMSEMQSNVMKTLSEALKSTVSNIR